MKKAIGYIRVSTEQQAEDGVSLDAQKAKIAAWCVMNDYDLADILVDAGISGKSMENREGLKAALADVKKGMALVVYSLSRLARSTKDCIEIAETLKKKGSDLVSLTEKIDTSSAIGEFFFTLIAALGQMERKQIAERTKMALAHKKANGEKYAHVPFGFTEVEGRLVKVEEEALVLAEMVSQRKSGSTLVQIAGYLNQRGITGKKGGEWAAGSVKRVLDRQAA